MHIATLENNFKSAIADEQRARSVLANYTGWMSEARITNAQTIKQAAYDNALIYNRYALACRDNPYGSSCIDTWNDYLSSCGTQNTKPV